MSRPSTNAGSKPCSRSVSESFLGLRCRGLDVAFAGRAVLAGLSLTVRAGEVCAVVGESGSGKTTLLSVVAGFVTPDRGEVQIGGEDVGDDGPSVRDATMLFQEPRLFPALTVVENVGFGLRVRGASRTARRNVAQQLLDEVGLLDRADDSIAGLSGGEQQRVALARALCVAPKLLLLDEPFSAVDAPRRRELRDVVGSMLRRHQTTAVFVSHDIHDAVAMADTVAVLIDGRIVQHDLVAAVRANPASAAVEQLVSGDPIPPGPAR